MTTPAMPPTDDVVLTSREAFLAMSEYVWQWLASFGDDLIQVVSDTDTTVSSDGGPADPAAWDDWMRCVDRVRSGLPLRTEQILLD